jgi:hypothetical protein
MFFFSINNLLFEVAHVITIIFKINFCTRIGNQIYTV